MEWIVKGLPGVLLLLNAWQDVRKREIVPWSLWIFLILGIIGNAVKPMHSLWSMLGGAAVGIGMLLISVFSRGSVGLGDGFLLCVTGIYLGLEANLLMLLGALFLCALFSILLLCFRKAGRKTNVPFVPFLLAGYLWGLLF